MLGPAERFGIHEQQLEDHDLRGEESRGKRSQNAGEDGYGGPEETQRGGVGPEHPGRRQPARDRTQQAGHVLDVDDAKGNGANTEEQHEEGLAGAQWTSLSRGEDCEKDQTGGDQGELLKDIADGVEIAEIHKGLRHPDKRENRVDNCQGQGAGTRGAGQEEGNPPSELNDRGEIGERHAERDVGDGVLPGGGEVAGDQAQEAEKDGGSAIDVKPEI